MPSIRSHQQPWHHYPLKVVHKIKYQVEEEKGFIETYGYICPYGEVGNIIFETRTGELIQIVLKESTPYIKNLNLERTKQKEVLIPHNTIVAIGDFVVVSEEDLI